MCESQISYLGSAAVDAKAAQNSAVDSAKIVYRRLAAVVHSRLSSRLKPD